MNSYPTYKDSGIEWLGQIPTHWELTRISSVLTEVKDLNISLCFLHPSQFKFGDIILKPDVNIKDVSSLSKCTIFRKNDILINGLNLNYDFVTQRIARADYTGIITSAYFAVRVRNNLSSKYVTYLFKALDSRKVFNGLGTGIRLTLTYKELKKYYILLPPQEEQRQIVAYLDYKSNKIDERICQRERELQTLSELKQAEIAAVVTRGLDPNVPMKESGIEWLGKIPAHWELLRNKIFITERDNVVGQDAYKYTLLSLTKQGVIQRDIESGKGKFPKEFDNYKIVESGNIIFCLFDVDETPRTVGLSSIDGMITGAYNVFSIKGINSQFYYYYFLAVDEAKALRPLYSGLRKVVKTERFAGLRIPVPPEEEQDAIVSYLQSRITIIDNYIAKLKEEINYLQEYKQRLISDVVTGKVDVRGVEIPSEK